MQRSRLRRSAKETRELMVAAGLRQLQSEGIGLGLDHLTLESARLDADIPRSSSHAAWSIDDEFTPQASFQRAVIQAWLLERQNTMFSDAASASVGTLFSDPENPPSASLIVWTAINAAMRAGLGVEGGEQGRTGGDFLSTDLAIRYAIASQPADERDQQMLDWLRVGELGDRAKRIDDSYKPLGELLGLRARPEFGEAAYEMFGVVVASLVEGIGLRTRILPEHNLDKPLIGNDEGDSSATLVALCVEALIPVFFEPVEGADGQ